MRSPPPSTRLILRRQVLDLDAPLQEELDTAGVSIELTKDDALDLGLLDELRAVLAWRHRHVEGGTLGANPAVLSDLGESV